jgi:hypothetical protein
MHPQMRAAPGNLVSDKLLNTMAQPPGVGAAVTLKQTLFNHLHDCTCFLKHTQLTLPSR